MSNEPKKIRSGSSAGVKMTLMATVGVACVENAHLSENKVKGNESHVEKSFGPSTPIDVVS